jgi:acyl-coenzyme A synthetase/AMP-(fatty) acid ligase/acyl carrier protein
MPEILSGLKVVCCGGEAVDRTTLDSLMTGPSSPGKLVHWYGPTETTVISTTYTVGRNAYPSRSMPIGGPITNTHLYVVDQHGDRVRADVPGELWIGGQGVARGYHNLPELSREKFIEDPFCGEPGCRVYRTGDIVRWLPGDILEFLGRSDQQIKIRGYRIELGEIEAVLLTHLDVSACAVGAYEDAAGGKRLVAHCVPADPGRQAEAAELRAHCSRLLPEYMIPSYFTFLDKLPLTIHGKVDRRSLPVPDFDDLASQAVQRASRDRLEQAVLEAWRDVLGVDTLSFEDDFFALGGDSLTAMRVVRKMEEKTGIRMSIRDFFKNRTVSEAARYLTGLSSPGAPSERTDHAEPRD